MEKTFSDGVLIEADMPTRPVPPGTKSRRWLAEHPEYTPPPETPPTKPDPDQSTDSEAKYCEGKGTYSFIFKKGFLKYEIRCRTICWSCSSVLY